MAEPLFHIVNRETAPDGPPISTGIPTNIWSFALYRRAPGHVYGKLLALLPDETEARLVCISLNATTTFLNTMLSRDTSND